MVRESVVIITKGKKDNIRSAIVLSQFAVRSSNGSVDTDATIAKFQGVLSQYVAERETETSQIGEAVEAVLDSHKGVRVNLDFLVSASCRALNAQPENFKTLGDKVRDFVRENASDKGEDGKPTDPTKPYHIGRGKGGGVGRWSDILAAKAAK